MRTRSPRSSRTRTTVVAVVAALGLVAGLSAAVTVAGAQVSPRATVNGTTLAGDGGKLTGCTLDVAVSPLPGEPAEPTTVAVTVAAVPPTAPEGAPVGLVADSDTTSATTWSHQYAMDDLVAPLPVAANGYRVKVAVAVDGAGIGSGTYWLACGSEQDGSPTRILFAIRWVAADGTASTELPARGVVEGWGAGVVLRGASAKGTATCTYAAGTTVLGCTYDNPGHGTEPGLVVPGNPSATYTVSVVGGPGGWLTDPSTVGTFVGREVCPRGGGGHDGGDGHDGGGGHGATVAAEGRWVCTHTVVIVEEPPEVQGTTQTAPPAAAAPPVPVAGRFTG